MKHDIKALFFTLIFGLFFTLACSTIGRKPSQDASAEGLAQALQETNILLSNAYMKMEEADMQLRFSNGKKSQSSDSLIQQNKQQALQMITALLARKGQLLSELSQTLSISSWDGTSPLLETHIDKNFFDRTETIEVKDLRDFDKSQQAFPFPLENRLFNHYSLSFLDNTEPPQSAVNGNSSVPNTGLQFQARLECDGDIIHPGGFMGLATQQSRSYEFDWYNSKINGSRIRIQITPEVSQCVFSFKPAGTDDWKYGMRLQALDQIQPAFLDLSRELEICAQPKMTSASGPESFFWSADFEHFSCPRSFDKITSLSSSTDAIEARFQALTGSSPAAADIKQENPMMPMDFSKAPQFDIIYVSSLNFSADFIGSLWKKMLRHHADQGTQIRILIPAVTSTQKDINLVQALAKNRPNVKYQIYQFKVAEGDEGGFIDKLHRVTHTKMMIGYSASHPENNFLITGGRNIRDSYYFRGATNLGKWKWLKNYSEGEEPYVYYQDMEVEIQGQDFVRAALAQGLAIWNRDLSNQFYRSTNINLPEPASAATMAKLEIASKEKSLIRQITSIPYIDGHQLEKFYVQMIDSAQSELIMTSPYFRPTEAISEAITRAHNRGVNIKILTRIHLSGDGSPKIAEDVNKAGINRHLKDAEIYEWTDNSILHAKLIVVDQRLSFISSVNLNHRSFLHDIESGDLILSPDTAKLVRDQILLRFLPKTKRVTEPQPVGTFDSVLLDLAEDYF